jgi:hypothetical protein
MSEERVEEKTGQEKPVWLAGAGAGAAKRREPPALLEMIKLQQRHLAKDEKWTAFWGGYVEFEGGAGEHIPRHIWVHDLLNAISRIMTDCGYIFAYPLPTMRRRFMYWLWELSKNGWKAPPPSLHERHRNNPDDFDAFDYALGFSDFWIRLFGTWKTVDMDCCDYGDAFKGQLEMFVYCHIDTKNSTAIQEADTFAAALAAVEAGEMDEDGRRYDDRKRGGGDSYYNDAGYYRGNRDYT